MMPTRDLASAGMQSSEVIAGICVNNMNRVGTRATDDQQMPGLRIIRHAAMSIVCGIQKR
jgi:hypothetical protein